MIELNQVIKEVSKKTGVDDLIVDVICKHVFKYTVDVFKDGNDNHDILFNRLFKFKLKTKFKGNKYSTK